MTDQNLLFYIRHHMEQGKPLGTIRAQLCAADWDVKKVDTVIERFLSRPRPKSEPFVIYWKSLIISFVVLSVLGGFLMYFMRNRGPSAEDIIPILVEQLQHISSVVYDGHISMQGTPGQGKQSFLLRLQNLASILPASTEQVPSSGSEALTLTFRGATTANDFAHASFFAFVSFVTDFQAAPEENTSGMVELRGLGTKLYAQMIEI